MGLKEVLLFLLQRLGHGRKAAVFNYYESERVWDKKIFTILQEEKLLVQAEDAQTIICTGCEKLCEKTIRTEKIPMSCVSFSSKPSSPEKFMYHEKIYCDTFNQSINVISRQWQLTNEMLIAWLTKYLRLEPPKEANRAGVIQIGTATLKGETYALAFGTSEELVLLVNGDAVPIADIFQVSEGGAIELNTDLIEGVSDNFNPLIPKNPDKAKRNTQLFKKYHEIKAQFPNLKSDEAVIRQLMKDKELVGDLTSESIRRILSNQKKLSK